MNYQETLKYLFDQLPMYQREGKSAYKANLDNTLAFDEYFGNPHKEYLTIHVAGTNGKGSVSHMLTSILQKAGYKTGLYTSPHLKDFRERIRINGAIISEQEVIDFVQLNKTKINELKPSFFEMTVAMAFNVFRKENVDIAIIETGMGGRLDSTNIINPLISIITNIGLDHTKFLGDNLYAIAHEKAGIIKQNIPVVIGETNIETKDVFVKKANELNAPIVFADSEFNIVDECLHNNFQNLTIKKEKTNTQIDLSLDLIGEYQKKNVLTVLTAIKVLENKITVNNQHIYEGLNQVIKTTGLKGRWQILGEKPKIVCDTGHNTEGLTFILKQLKAEVYKKLHIIFGMVDDKDFKKVLKMMPKNATYYFTKAKIPRSMDSIFLAEQALKFNLKGNAFKDVSSAINEAKKNATPEDLIFIGGSTFIVADIPDL